MRIIPIDIKKIKIFTKKCENPKYNYLFVHGFASDHNCFNGVVDTIKDSNVYSFDLPNHGESADFKVSQMNLQNFARILIAIIRKYRLTNIILVGHSMGAGVVCLAYPHIKSKITKVVLIDPLNKTVFYQSENLKKVFKTFFNKDRDEAFDLLIEDSEKLRKWKYYQDAIKKPIDKFMQHTGMYSLLGINIIRPANLSKISSVIKNIHIPTILIMGENDHIFNPEKTTGLFKSLNNNIPHFLIPNSAHAPFIENLPEFVKIFNNFINNNAI